MESSCQLYCAVFADTAFEISCHDEDALAIVKFLLADFNTSVNLPATAAKQSYRLAATTTESQKQFTLYEKAEKTVGSEKLLYSGTSRYQLAYTLINEIIFHCINHNTQHHALHSGAVWRGKSTILLPAASGSGKSTLTAWLVANGFHYLTDELVFLENDGSITPFIRPASFKVEIKELGQILSQTKAAQNGNLQRVETGDIISTKEGTMLAHRLLNPKFSSEKRVVSDVLFPQYEPGAAVDFLEISAAKGALYLMQSHVNARNLNGHGIADLSKIVRKCKIWRLIYSDFADIESIFHSSAGFFTWRIQV